MKLLALRHRLQEAALAGSDPTPLADDVAESDECYVNAGKKGMSHRDPDNPPRRRANKRRDHGTFANDRPPVAATIARGSGRACLLVMRNSDCDPLKGLVLATTSPGATLKTDEWSSYGRTGPGPRNGVPRSWRGVRDVNVDGVREVHINTMEGTWTGLIHKPADTFRFDGLA